jgi:hypothetical protein
LLGALAAWRARSAPDYDEDVSWPLITLALFCAVVVAPVTAYQFCFHHAWSVLYVLDPQLYPGVAAWRGRLAFVVALCNLASVYGGFLATRRGVRHGSTLWTRAAPCGSAALIAGTLLVASQRVAYVGSFAEFWSAQAVVLPLSAAGWVALVECLLAAGFLAALGRRYPA